MRKVVVSAALLALAAWGVAATVSGAPATGKAPAKPVVKAPAIAWHTYDKGLRLASRQKKVALVDIMADWCGWCKKMDREVYTDRSVIALSNRVVFIKVNMDKQPDLKAKYHVQGVPTVVILKDGKEIHRILGYEPAPQFVKDVQQALRQPHSK